jgi:hypothetical protein
MAARESKPTGDSFVELLRQQIEILQSGDYEYERLDIYTAGPMSRGPSNPEPS